MQKYSWQEAQVYEKDWWGNCINTLFEEEKQLIYADRMGLDLVGSEKTPYVFDLKGASVLDIGGGPTSILFKCINFQNSTVIDPLPMPKWVIDRYSIAGIKLIQQKGEEPIKGVFDLIIGTNLLQHTENPVKVVNNVLQASKIIKWFDWIETGISDGHIHNLHEKELNKWFGGEGKVEKFQQRPLYGTAWYGTFLGKHYDKNLSEM